MSAKIFFIAGEPSGDALGGRLIQSLKSMDEAIEVEGIGGAMMEAQGMKSLLPMDDLCVVGIWEIIWHLPRLIKLVYAIVEDVEKRQPDILVTIDLPDFNFKVAQILKKRGVFKGKIVHYVAPSVWAWRSGRAEKIAGFLDGMMCLFPFEPDYFTRYRLDAQFVGHPLPDIDFATLHPEQFCKDYGIEDDALRIGLFFGSRPGELQDIAPVLLETVRAVSEQYEDFFLIVPTLPHMEIEVTNMLVDLPYEFCIVTDQERKWDAFAACDLAVAVSGTVGLELAYLGVPHVITYKVHPLTWLVLKFLVKVRYAHLANIILDKPVIPELLQWQCTPFHVSKALLELIQKPETADKQRRELEGIVDKLRAPRGMPSSDCAAQYLLGFVKQH